MCKLVSCLARCRNLLDAIARHNGQSPVLLTNPGVRPATSVLLTGRTLRENAFEHTRSASARRDALLSTIAYV